jgi:hypothetical protein
VPKSIIDDVQGIGDAMLAEYHSEARGKPTSVDSIWNGPPQQRRPAPDAKWLSLDCKALHTALPHRIPHGT